MKILAKKTSVTRTLSLVVACGMVLSLAGVPTLAQETATFAGAILDPDGEPADGFKVVLQDVVTKTTFTSDATDASGAYSVGVPVGGRYTPMEVIAPDGTRIAVRAVPPYAATEPSNYRLDITFVEAPGAVPPPPPTTTTTDTGAAAAAGAGAAAAADEEAEGAPPSEGKKKKEWYKKPGIWIGIAVGVAAIVYAVTKDDDEDTPPEPPVSPFVPSGN